MKRSLLICWLFAAVVCARGSVDVNADGNVRFCYHSLFAKKVIVNIAGKQVEMEKADIGEFTAELSGLQPDMYTYTYTIDGVETLDPDNLLVVRDCNRRYSYLIVGGEGADLYKTSDVEHGIVEQSWYLTDDGRQHAMTVYLPPSYKTGKGYYPVLYLLHGTGGDCLAWRDLGRVAQIADNLISQGRSKELIIIMPNCNYWQQESPEKSGIEESWNMMGTTMRMMDGKFEENFGNLVNQVEKQYRVLTRKNSRAIAGLSRGGYFAYHISHFYNMMFDYVGLFSATYRTDGKSRVYRNIEKDLVRQFQTPPALYYISIGKDDFLYDENKAFRKMLDEKGIGYIYNESAGGHEWSNWRRYLVDFLPRLFKN